MVEPMKGRMTHGNENPVGLTLREIEMLRFFLSNEGEIFSHDFLMTKFWGLDYSGSESAVTQAISRLREKLGKGKGCMIESVYGQGFRLMVSIGK
jgi:DNA-binding response OmpR family regulator